MAGNGGATPAPIFEDVYFAIMPSDELKGQRAIDVSKTCVDGKSNAKF